MYHVRDTLPDMKTATLPPVRITPDLRNKLSNVLREGETVSAFVNEAVRQQIEQRDADRGWLSQAWAAHAQMQATGVHETPEALMADLRASLAAAKARANG